MLPGRPEQGRNDLFLRKRRPAADAQIQSRRRTTGWRRYEKRMLARLSRLGGTPYSIAAGVACGVAVSFTPFVGLHFVLAVATAWLVRGNVLAGMLGTAPAIRGLSRSSGFPCFIPGVFCWANTAAAA